MAKVFRSYVELQKGLTTTIHLALAEVARETFDDWYDMVSDRLYKQNMLKTGRTDSGYRRSYDLLNALEIKWITPLKCEIGYNTEKIRATQMAYGELNRHMSIGLEDWSEALPYFIEFGNNPNGKNPIIEYDGIGAFSAIINILKYSFNSELKKNLRKRGLGVE